MSLMPCAPCPLPDPTDPAGTPRSIFVPDDGYLSKIQALCKKHNILLICDEVQTVRGFLRWDRVPIVLTSFLVHSRVFAAPERCASRSHYRSFTELRR